MRLDSCRESGTEAPRPVRRPLRSHGGTLDQGSHGGSGEGCSHPYEGLYFQGRVNRIC